MTTTVIGQSAPAGTAARTAAGQTGERAVSGSVRAGFIGSGFMAAVHSRAARAAGAQLAAIASSSAESAQRASAKLGIAKAYESVDRLLGDDTIDIVHVCTPNTTHAAITEAVIAAGKHVICEKPLATTVADAEALRTLAATAGITAAVPFVYRFHPMVREARARILAGATGRVLSVSGNYLQDWLAEPVADDWRVDAALGGPSRAFADIGSHLVDLLEFVTGDRILRLNATSRTVYGERGLSRDITTEDLVALVVELRGGAVGTLLVSQVAAGRKNSLVLEITGARESVRFDQERPDELWLGRRSGSELMQRDAATLSSDAARYSVVPAGHPMGYQDAFNAFVADSYAATNTDARDGNTTAGLPTFDDGLRAVRITAAVLASAQSGQWVEVAE
ncbi:Gfo/Idh/MocA family protein [Leucobacter komagatae]|uniref:Oxidoreductase n=1 Tax=Leucobacter komagatae TaxID=55969 RepID=A0A0D0H7S5_9MICO|nr:Gfo/Idh/MocA family oxidoreductase [Leucobacter komagatae]KIP53275.1 oxidoreductase [Leucobacter komagatae]